MKLIDKDALVAEIERLIERAKAERVLYPKTILAAKNYLLIEDYKKLLFFLDTLEVKEVDLDNMIEEWEDSFKNNPASMRYKETAKHFFELGLNARIDKELVEEVYSHIDSIKDTADRMTSGNFMHNRAAIKFSANTIAKVLELMGLKAQKGE